MLAASDMCICLLWSHKVCIGLVIRSFTKRGNHLIEGDGAPRGDARSDGRALAPTARIPRLFACMRPDHLRTYRPRTAVAHSNCQVIAIRVAAARSQIAAGTLEKSIVARSVLVSLTAICLVLASCTR